MRLLHGDRQHRSADRSTRESAVECADHDELYTEFTVLSGPRAVLGIFGPQAFVLTINGQGTRTWSRYIFPDTITDWALNAGTLYLRTAGNLIWEFTDEVIGCDDAPGSAGA